ncbi:hypothetical protein THASP1DRAFT_27573 [Thamnocephalis sphaerospora]|uniref:B30.2/SPRY domain-containing protein n=1 Tax=Thamnocephalis sphaerospora TaxID=78915 RepID=A0A4P9XWF2_9FUNG|nr:hypothetical protein THASP1DRAFT_27573 [Thamnocephalis sphaerospora]|eukprot:RKP10647.1 hypothetical protein THASP1DRAFT_27573 [Thamnocephalis sphaerospora]
MDISALISHSGGDSPEDAAGFQFSNTSVESSTSSASLASDKAPVHTAKEEATKASALKTGVAQAPGTEDATTTQSQSAAVPAKMDDRVKLPTKAAAVEAFNTTTAAAAAAAAAERERDDEGASLLLQLAAGAEFGVRTDADADAAPVTSASIESERSPTTPDVPSDSLDVTSEAKIAESERATSPVAANVTTTAAVEKEEEMDVKMTMELERALETELDEELVDITAVTTPASVDPIATSAEGDSDVRIVSDSSQEADQMGAATTTAPFVQPPLEPTQDVNMRSDTAEDSVQNHSEERPMATPTGTKQNVSKVPIALESEAVALPPADASLGQTCKGNAIQDVIMAEALAPAPSEAKVNVTALTGEPTRDVLVHRRHKARRCYCGRDRHSAKRPSIPCVRCGLCFHIDCIPSASRYWKAILPGDNFFHLICTDCGDGQETFQRQQLDWLEVTHLALFTLSHMSPWKERDPQEDGRVYFAWRQDICALIESRWEQFWLREQHATWRDDVAAALRKGAAQGRFESGEQNVGRPGLWALSDVGRFPQSYADDSAQRDAAAEAGTADRVPAYDITLAGKLVDLAPLAQNVASTLHPFPATPSALEAPPAVSPLVGDGGSHEPSPQAIEMGVPTLSRKRADLSDGALDDDAAAKHKRMKQESRRKLRKQADAERPGPTIAFAEAAMYPDLDNSGGPVRLSRQPTHTSARVHVSDDGMATWNEKGYRLAKASHSVCEGTWYYEARLGGDGGGNARIGWSQISGDLQGPCGLDHFSYGYRASPGTAFHRSVGHTFGDGYGPGDVLGVLLHIPSLTPSEREDLASRRWQFGAEYEPFRYACPTPAKSSDASPEAADTLTPKDSEIDEPMPRVHGSDVRYYKNGQLIGTAFSDLFLGHYYPAVSCYMGAHVTVNFGPDFAYCPVLEDGTRPRPIAELEREAVGTAPIPTSAHASSRGQPTELEMLSPSSSTDTEYAVSLPKVDTDVVAAASTSDASTAAASAALQASPTTALPTRLE